MEKNTDQKQNCQTAIKALKDAIKDNMKKRKTIKTNTMRKYLILSLLIVLITINLNAQSVKDSTDILLKCIELDELQQFYPTETDGSLKPICIMQYPVSFSKDLELSEEGKRMIFMSPSEIRESKIKAYVTVRSLKIEELSATVNLNLFYNYDPVTLKYTFKQILVKLTKAGGIWEVENSTIK